MARKLDAREARFRDEYLIDLDPKRAAIAAGYSASIAASKAYQWVSNSKVKPHLFEAIQEMLGKRSEELGIAAKDVLQRWSDVAMADPNELTSIITGSCRFCHGANHQYQWRDEAEFEAAQEAHFDLPDEQRSKKAAPVIAGGFGYKWRVPPHADCPRCDGFGRSRTVIRDTTELSPQALALFAGVKETQNGIEIKMHDQMAALTNVAKHLGMFVDKVDHTSKDGSMSPQPVAVYQLPDNGRE